MYSEPFPFISALDQLGRKVIQYPPLTNYRIWLHWINVWLEDISKCFVVRHPFSKDKDQACETSFINVHKYLLGVTWRKLYISMLQWHSWVVYGRIIGVYQYCTDMGSFISVSALGFHRHVWGVNRCISLVSNPAKETCSSWSPRSRQAHNSHLPSG